MSGSWLPALLLCTSALGHMVTLNNTTPRRDTAGNIINAHDGTMLQDENNTFWWFGTAYPHCPEGDWTCHGQNSSYAAYSSPDLVHWTLESSDIFPSRVEACEWKPDLSYPPEHPYFSDAPCFGPYFRPHVLHAPQNEPDEQWVLWASGGNWGGYFTATAARPQGPYTSKHWNVTMGSGWVHNGDFTLFTDDDGKAYILYHGSGCDQELGLSCWPPAGLDGTMAVDLLTPDFTSSTGRTSGIFDVRGSEAPAMFKRGGKYFLATATGCGFCAEGSGARIFTADAALGPYLDAGLDLNPCKGHASHPGPINGSSACGLLKSSCMPACGNAPHEVTAQQAWVLRLQSNSTTQQEQWLWAGDFWGSAPDGYKDHDFQTWLPLDFADNGMPLPLKNVSSFSVVI